jgi:hypothetical protein
MVTEEISTTVFFTPVDFTGVIFARLGYRRRGSSSGVCKAGGASSGASDVMSLVFALPVSRLMTRATFAESSSWRRLSNPLCSPGRCLLASGFFTQNLLCQPSVVEIATRGFIIRADRLPGTCCFSEFHRPMYHCFIGEILKLIMDFLEDITVKFRASVIHGWQRTHHENLIVLSHDTLNKPTVCPSVASHNLLLYQSLPLIIPYRYALLRRRKDDTGVGTASRGIVA